MASELRVDKIIPVDGVPSGGGGGIIQVVHSSATAEASQSNSGTTQNTLTDTGLSATITPKFSTSKVLVLVHQTYQIDNGNNNVQFQINMLLRDGSNNVLHGGLGYNALRWKNGYAASDIYSLNFLHSPNTTNAFTYKMTMNYYYMSSGSGSLRAQRDDQANTRSEMTLMEVSA
jgi:hypothetical protein|tara:strand:- start:28 stop:549 length:522 start_codon:yes stop_codon:yes gene_type:complete